MKTRGPSITVKLVALQLVAFVLVAAILGVIQYRATRQALYEELERSAANVMQAIEDEVAENPDLLTDSALSPIVERFTGKFPDVAVLSIVDHSGRVIAASEPPAGQLVTADTALNALVRDGNEHRSYVERDGRRYFRLSRPLQGRYDPARRSKVVGAITIDVHVTPVDARIAESFRHRMLILLTLLTVTGSVLYLASRRIFVLPLTRLADAADGFGTRGEAREVTIRTGDELEVLANAFNGMMRERRRSEETVSAARDTAETATRAKGEFLANMSHEIRTPMNGVMGMLDLALETELSPVQREYLQVAKSSADSLLTVIDDILDFSKVEAGRMELHAAPFSLGDTLADAMTALALRADQKGLELALRMAPGTPDAVVGDAGRLRQVLINLVGNAIKFTSRGEVVVTVDRSSPTGPDAVRIGEDMLHFTVADTGMGIPANKQAVIFEAFAQADTSTTRQFGGTGLGLAISSRLVAMMGGTIWVESEVGRGSVFHFSARFGTYAGPPLHEVAGDALELSGLPVLVVDDNATNRRILEELLTGWTMRPSTADGADAALAALEQARQAGTTFPLLLIDACMPGMDGFALIERIRHSPALSGVTIMMLSSTDQQGSAARCRELGVSAYLTKPIRPSHLFDAIVTSLAADPQRTATARRHALSPSTRKGRALRILLAEDNVVNQRLAVTILEKRGHSVVVAENGRVALEALDRELFDLVLMDVQMPEMGGFETTAAIRERETMTGAHLPIVAMTARAMAGDRERCLEAGMDAYVAKPIRNAELFAVIEALGGGISSDVIGSPRKPGVVGVVVDEARLRANVDGDAQLLRELCDIFRAELPALLAQMHASVKAGDAASLEHAAHSLKGAIGSLAGVSAFEAALKLEMIARRGQVEGAALAIAALEVQIERLETALGAICEDQLR